MLKTKRFWTLAMVSVIIAAAILGNWSAKDVSAEAEAYGDLKILTPTRGL
jgi:hypothetical protein